MENASATIFPLLFFHYPSNHELTPCSVQYLCSDPMPIDMSSFFYLSRSMLNPNGERFQWQQRVLLHSPRQHSYVQKTTFVYKTQITLESIGRTQDDTCTHVTVDLVSQSEHRKGWKFKTGRSGNEMSIINGAKLSKLIIVIGTTVNHTIKHS